MHTHLDEESTPGEWRISQVLVDPDEVNDWELRLGVDLARSRTENRPVLRFDGVAPIGT